jgi:hypothetical protein
LTAFALIDWPCADLHQGGARGGLGESGPLILRGPRADEPLAELGAGGTRAPQDDGERDFRHVTLRRESFSLRHLEARPLSLRHLEARHTLAPSP